MKTWADQQFRRDLLKLICLAFALAGGVALFVVTPSFSTPALLSVVFTMLFSPLVAALERRGYARIWAIILLFSTLGVAIAASTLWAIQSSEVQWETFKTKAPQYFELTIQKLKLLESQLKTKYVFLSGVNASDSVIKWAADTSRWFVTNGASVAGELIAWLFLVPIFTFVLLNEGPTLRKRLFQLVPNRFFESAYLITNEISSALAEYLRAKLLEAFLVGALTTFGLSVIHAPYPGVLGVAAGLTNIIPYIGPIIGAVPGILIATLDPSQSHLLWSIVMVYIVVNLIDTVFIFPVVVAKLVNLHPLILIAVVAVGQKYYGLIGMLISIPIAAAIKVVLVEIYSAIYEQRSGNRRPDRPVADVSIFGVE